MNNLLSNRQPINNIPIGCKLIVRSRNDGGMEYIIRKDNDLDDITGFSTGWITWVALFLFLSWFFGCFDEKPTTNVKKESSRTEIYAKDDPSRRY